MKESCQHRFCFSKLHCCSFPNYLCWRWLETQFEILSVELKRIIKSVSFDRKTAPFQSASLSRIQLLHQVFPKHILKNISQGRGNFGFRASKYVINQGIKLVLSLGFLQNGYLLIASQFQGLDLWLMTLMFLMKSGFKPVIRRIKVWIKSDKTSFQSGSNAAHNIFGLETYK